MEIFSSGQQQTTINTYSTGQLKRDQTPLQSSQKIADISAVLSGKKKFTVAVRIRPQLNSQESNLFMTVKHNTPYLSTDQLNVFQQNVTNLEYNTQKTKRFVFDKVFGENSSNQAIFRSLISEKVCLLKKGVNLSILAYGATNSGKTFTVVGSGKEGIQGNDLCDDANIGLSVLTFEKVLKECSKDFSFNFSFLQIYNECVYDLLSHSQLNVADRKSLSVLEDSQGKNQVIGLSKYSVQNIATLSELISKGLAFRKAADNAENSQSSRSHALMQLQMTQKMTKRKVKLTIVDLAGSQKYISRTFERNQSSLNVQLKEGANINKSLLTLGNCIKNLQEGEKHIPYRDSKLTRLLKDHLKGYSHNIMVVCIAKTAHKWEENQNSLNYALKAMKIEKQLQRNYQNQELSHYRCSNCKDNIPYSIIKSIIRDEEIKLRPKKPRQLDLPSPLACSSPIQKMFSKRKTESKGRILLEQAQRIAYSSILRFQQFLQSFHIQQNLSATTRYYIENYIQQQGKKLGDMVSQSLEIIKLENSPKRSGNDNKFVLKDLADKAGVSQFCSSQMDKDICDEHISTVVVHNQKAKSKPKQRSLSTFNAHLQETATLLPNSTATESRKRRVSLMTKPRQKIRRPSCLSIKQEANTADATDAAKDTNSNEHLDESNSFVKILQGQLTNKNKDSNTIYHHSSHQVQQFSIDIKGFNEGSQCSPNSQVFPSFDNLNNRNKQNPIEVLRVQVLDNEQKMLNERKNILNKMQLNQQRRNITTGTNHSSPTMESGTCRNLPSMFKFSSTQKNPFKGRNVQSFSKVSQNALLKLDRNQVTTKQLICIQDPDSDENDEYENDKGQQRQKSGHPPIELQINKKHFGQVLNNSNSTNQSCSIMLDSTCMAPRMQRDEDQFVGTWKNIFIKKIESAKKQSQSCKQKI